MGIREKRTEVSTGPDEAPQAVFSSQRKKYRSARKIGANVAYLWWGRICNRLAQGRSAPFPSVVGLL